MKATLEHGLLRVIVPIVAPATLDEEDQNVSFIRPRLLGREEGENAAARVVFGYLLQVY